MTEWDPDPSGPGHPPEPEWGLDAPLPGADDGPYGPYGPAAPDDLPDPGDPAGEHGPGGPAFPAEPAPLPAEPADLAAEADPGHPPADLWSGDPSGGPADPAEGDPDGTDPAAWSGGPEPDPFPPALDLDVTPADGGPWTDPDLLGGPADWSAAPLDPPSALLPDLAAADGDPAAGWRSLLDSDDPAVRALAAHWHR